MKWNKSFRPRSIRFAAIAAFIALGMYMIGCNQGPPENSRAAQAMRGQELFDQHCVDCHSENAILADSLSKPAPDLTKINERWGGTFPVVQIARMIDGRRHVQAHGEREMPIWGEEFKQEGELTEEDIKGKLGELVAYLISIQK